MIKESVKLNEQEQVEVLKQELNLYPRYEVIVQTKYINPMMELEEKLKGMVRKEERSGSPSGFYREKKNIIISNMDALKKMKEESSEYILVKKIEDDLERLHPVDRDLIIEKFKYGISYSSLAERHNMSKTGMQKKIESVLRMIVRNRLFASKK